MRQHSCHVGGVSGHRDAAGSATTERAVAPGRILLVDDSDDVRRLLLLYLRSTDAQIVEARDGRSACDAAFAAQNENRDFDVILLDMELPQLDGYTAATMLRLQGFCGPIVALTANDAAGERERCVASGCTQYLHKPVDRERLVRTVGDHLARRCGGSTQPAKAVEVAARAGLGGGGGGGGGAVDAAVEPFLRQFLASLPEYVGQLEDLLGRRAIAQLAQTVHQIKGAAGMYGFERIYEVAASAEGVAKALARAAAPDVDVRRLRGEVDALIGVIRGTCACAPQQEDGGRR
jgi:CheY-like chemotaxis protein/HPt (histidine-containing phosphotransfer) domain-containing protein